jgi:hypothetical protein
MCWISHFLPSPISRAGEAEEEQGMIARRICDCCDKITTQSICPYCGRPWEVPRTQGFNVFKILRIEQLEIPHSNFLAFILDPANSKLLFLDSEMMCGQEDCFLKAVLKDLLENATRSAKLPPSFPLAAGNVDATKLEGVKVEREWTRPAEVSVSAPPVTWTDDLFAEALPDASCSPAKRGDLLISCKHPQFFVVIENKIRAPEGDGQLTSYEEMMKQELSDDQPLYVYMTRKGLEPRNNPGWMVYKHAYLADAIQRVRDQFQASIRADVLAILDHFLELNRGKSESMAVAGEAPSDDAFLISSISGEQCARCHSDAEMNPKVVTIRQSVAEIGARLDTLEKEYNALIDQRNALRREGDNMVSQIARMAIITEATKHHDWYVRSLAHAYLTSHPGESEGGCVGATSFASEDAREDPARPDPGCAVPERPKPG